MINTNVVWLEDPMKYAYLRERLYDCMKNRKFPYYNKKLFGNQKAIVGYKLMQRVGDIDTYIVWWLKDYDYDFNQNGPYSISHRPCEAVSPTDVIKRYKKE